MTAQATIETQEFGTLVIAIKGNELLYSHTSIPISIEIVPMNENTKAYKRIELLDAPYGLEDSEINEALEMLEAQI